VPENDITVRTYPFNKTHVNLTCVVTGAQPQPSLKLYVEGVESKGSDRVPLVDWYKDDPWVSLDVVIKDALEPAVIECEMWIPETEYKRRERIVYYPSSNRSNGTRDFEFNGNT